MRRPFALPTGPLRISNAVATDSALALRSGLLTALLGTLLYLAVSGIRYTHGGATAFDLGYYLQAIHAIAHGNLNPSPAISPGHSYLADNLALYLYVLAPLFRLWPSPWLLLFFQAAWLAAATGIVVYEAALRKVRAGTLWLFAAMLLAAPAALSLIWFDFHFDALGGLLGLLVALSLDRGRLRAAWLWAMLCLLVKEDAGVVLVAAGLWHLFGPVQGSKTRWHAGAIALMGVAAVIVGGWLLGQLSPSHAATTARIVFFSKPGLGAELRAALPTVLWSRKWLYLLALFLPLGFLPLFSPRRLPAIMAAVALNLLALDPSFYTGNQYNGYAIPFLALGAAEGLVALASIGWLRLRIALAAIGLLLGQLFTGLPLVADIAPIATPGMPAGIASIVPRGDRRAVITTNQLAVYVDPRFAASIIPLSLQASYLGHISAIARHPTVVLPRDPQGTPTRELRQLLLKDGYSIVRSDAVALVLHRTGPAAGMVVRDVETTQDQLRWRDHGVATKALASPGPGVYQISVRTAGFGLAELCAGTTPSDTVCSAAQPMGDGQPLQIVTFTESGVLRLHVFSVSGTKPPAVSGPVSLTRLGYSR